MSIESSPRWRSQLRNRYPVLEQAEANASARLQRESASLEPTGLWGIPMGWTTRPRSLRRQQVLNYSAIPCYVPSPLGALWLGLSRSTCYAVRRHLRRRPLPHLLFGSRALRLAHAGTISSSCTTTTASTTSQQQPRAVVRDDAAGRQTCAASAAPRCAQGCPAQLDGLPRRLAAAPADLQSAIRGAIG